MHKLTEKNTDNSAEKGENNYFYNAEKRKADGFNSKTGGSNAKKLGYAVGNESGCTARYKAGVVDKTYTAHLKGKNSSRHGSSEKGGEYSRHTAQNSDWLFLWLEVHCCTYITAYAAADLQSRTLTSGRTAAEVGESGGNENNRHKEDRDVFTEVYGAYNCICAFALGLCYLIKKYYEKSANRH